MQVPPSTTDQPVAIDREHALDLLHQMLRIRRFEEKCAELYSAGKIRGFLHLYNGEEAIAAGVIPVLSDDDAIVATYREHGHALARGIEMNAVMAELYGKVEGCSRGRGGSMHLFDVSRRFYGGHAIVASGLPMAVGLALADKLRGRTAITAVFFGDGAVAEGEFHETMNLAALWKLPVLFLCENNRYAMGTAIERAQAEPELYRKAAGYRIPSEVVDGMDVLAVDAAAKRAAAAVREGNGPYFLELRTYRFRAHSMYDPDIYRDKAEVEAWKSRDPIPTFIERLRAAGIAGDNDMRRLEATIEAELEAAVAYAEAGTWEPVADLTRFVYSEVS